MGQGEFEQRLVEEMADDIAGIATDRFREDLASSRGRVFEIGDGAKVKLIAVDLYDVGGMLNTVEAEDCKRYLVRLEIRSGHYAFEAIPLEADA
jgi:hypothetical protein